MNAHETTDTASRTSVASNEVSPGHAFCVAVHIIALFTGFIGPLVMLVFSGRDLPKQHARIAFNWQMSLTVYVLVPLLFFFLFPRESQSAALLGLFLLSLVVISIFVLLLLLYDVIACIIAAAKASQGIMWRYPLSLPFLKVNYKITQSSQNTGDGR